MMLPRLAGSLPIGRSLAGGAVLAAMLTIAVGCSAERPELVRPVAENGTTVPPTIPLPDRTECTTASGPGPVTVTVAVAVAVAPETVPCLTVAAHHRLELVNQGPAPADLVVGRTAVALAAGASQVTEPAGAILTQGPNRILAGADTVAFAWLVEPAQSPLAGTVIGLSSIGDIELGYEPAAVTAASGGVPVAAAGTPCHMATLDGDPYSPLFTFRQGRLVVVQVFTPGLVTRSGIGLGSTGADIAAAYGSQIEARPDPNDPARQLLIFVPSDPENQIYRLVFDLTDDRVTTIRFGATEIVADQPGCGP